LRTYRERNCSPVNPGIIEMSAPAEQQPADDAAELEAAMQRSRRAAAMPGPPYAPCSSLTSAITQAPSRPRRRPATASAAASPASGCRTGAGRLRRHHRRGREQCAGVLVLVPGRVRRAADRRVANRLSPRTRPRRTQAGERVVSRWPKTVHALAAAGRCLPRDRWGKLAHRRS
jgi:hypothetical protein